MDLVKSRTYFLVDYLLAVIDYNICGYDIGKSPGMERIAHLSEMRLTDKGICLV